MAPQHNVSFPGHAGRGRAAETGVTLIEVLVALIVLMIGLLGIAGLQVQAQRAELESYQRAQALVLLQDMIDQVTTHRRARSCFAVTTDGSTGSPYLGTAGPGHAGPPVCVATGGSPADAAAVLAIEYWNEALLGTSETRTSGGTTLNAGAMEGARGCVALDTTPQPDTFTVAVAWQGFFDSSAPVPPAGATPGLAAAINCAKDLYGAETKRRVVWTQVRFANLD